MTYITSAGECWDEIARAVYGDEFMLGYLMLDRANAPLLDIEVFPAGVRVNVPEVTAGQQYEDDLPDWRKTDG